MLNVLSLYLSLYFFCFSFLFPLFIISRGLLSCDRVQFHCTFPILMWLPLLMLCPYNGSFIFRILGFLSLVMAPSLVLCTRCILPFRSSSLLYSCCIKWPFGYPIRLLFLSWWACNVLNLAEKHGITLIAAYIYLLIYMWKLTISLGDGWFLSGTYFLA